MHGADDKLTCKPERRSIFVKSRVR